MQSFSYWKYISDGMRHEYLHNYTQYGAHLPNLEWLISQGTLGKLNWKFVTPLCGNKKKLPFSFRCQVGVSRSNLPCSHQVKYSFPNVCSSIAEVFVLTLHSIRFSIATGVNPARHGIECNQLTNQQAQNYFYRRIQKPTIFEAAKKVKTFSITPSKLISLFCTFVYNRRLEWKSSA